jgi:hypothetical protein
MEKRYDFIDKTLHIIRKQLSDKLPNEAPLEKMIIKTKELLKDIYVSK